MHIMGNRTDVIMYQRRYWGIGIGMVNGLIMNTICEWFDHDLEVLWSIKVSKVHTLTGYYRTNIKKSFSVTHWFQ